jgi:hypothetical protein
MLLSSSREGPLKTQSSMGLTRGLWIEEDQDRGQRTDVRGRMSARPEKGEEGGKSEGLKEEI